MSQFGAEFRRFSLDRSKPGRFDEFYGLLQHVHRIPNVELLVGYADVHGDLLPINNDDNYHKAITTASPLLRLFLQRKGKRPSPKATSETPNHPITFRLSVCSIARVCFSLQSSFVRFGQVSVEVLGQGRIVLLSCKALKCLSRLRLGKLWPGGHIRPTNVNVVLLLGRK